MKEFAAKTVFVVSLILAGICKCHAQYFERFYGDSLNATSSYLSVCQDGKSFIGGSSFDSLSNISSYYVLKISEEGNTEWEKKIGDFYNAYTTSVLNLNESIIALSGTHANALYNSLTEVLYLDSSGNVLNSKVFPPLNGWGTSSVAMSKLTDSTVAINSYTDGFVSTNYYSVFSLNKDLSVRWNDFVGYDGSLTNIHGLTTISGESIYTLAYYPAFVYSPLPLTKISNIIKRTVTGEVVSDSLYEFNCIVNSISETKDGGAIIGGMQDSSLQSDLMLIRLDSSGNNLWQREYGSELNEEINSVIETSDGGFVILSTIEDSVLPGQNDLMILKTNENGDSLWSRQYGATLNETAVHLEEHDSDLFILGKTNSFQGNYIYTIKTNSEGIIEVPYTINSAGRFFCEGDTTVLQINPAPLPNMIIEWSNGDSSASTVITTTGNYFATIKDSLGNIFRTTITPLYFTAQPDAYFGIDSIRLCEGKMLVDSAPAELTNTYQWYFNGSPLPNQTQSYLIPQSTGTYQLIVTNACSSDTSQAVVESLLPLPSVPVISSPPVLYVCENDSLRLSASVLVTESVQWYTSDQGRIYPVPGATDSVFYVITDGTYIVESINSYGCIVYSNPKQVIFDHTFETVSANGPLSFCSGGEVDLTVSPGTGYIWSNGDTTQTILVDSSGGYSVSFTNLFGCRKFSDTLNIKVNGRPAIDIGDDTTFCNGGTLNIDAGAGFNNYFWSDGSTIQTFSATPLINVPDTFEIFVFVTDSNSCTNSDTLNLFVDICNGLNSIKNKNVVVFPNPLSVGQPLFVQGFHSGNFLFILKDISGRIVFSETSVNNGRINPDKMINSGIYFYSISHAGILISSGKLILN